MVGTISIIYYSLLQYNSTLSDNAKARAAFRVMCVLYERVYSICFDAQRSIFLGRLWEAGSGGMEHIYRHGCNTRGKNKRVVFLCYTAPYQLYSIHFFHLCNTLHSGSTL